MFSTVRTQPLDGSLAPGEHRIYFADGETPAKPGHLPFKLNKSGEALWLAAVNARGAVTLVDRAYWTRQRRATNRGRGSARPARSRHSPPRPAGRTSTSAGTVHIELTGDPQVIRLASHAAPGQTYLIESMVPQELAAWSVVSQLAETDLRPQSISRGNPTTTRGFSGSGNRRNERRRSRDGERARVWP